MTKKIGILTSGGDCAGLNAVIRAVVYRAHNLGYETIGIENGTAGLLSDPVRVKNLHPKDFDGHVMRLGGTVLGTTNSSNPFRFRMPDGDVKDRSNEIVAGFKELELEALIGIGGDGSFDILSRLTSKGGINFVGIPKTIDNDVGQTELSVGFDTAVAVATEALDRLQPTAASHDRVMILEVMGRDAGHIALNAGIAGGADVILIPEIPYTIESVAKKINNVQAGGRRFGLVVVSEAVKTLDGQKQQNVFYGGKRTYGGIGEYLGPLIAEATGSETRVTVLGHVQRGGQPTYNDRLLASAFGVRAVDLVHEGKFGRVVAMQNWEVTDVPLEEVVAACYTVPLDGTLMHTARALGISFGDE